MKKNWLIRSFCILLFAVIVTSCFTVRPAAVKTNKKLFETFFLGDQGTQYFIKPLIFQDDFKNYLELDITFRYLDKILDSAIINFSIYSREHIKALDSITINNKGYSVVARDVNYLYSERSKQFFKSRFSTKVGLSDLIPLFSNNAWSITPNKTGYSQFFAPKSTKTKIDRLNFNIFSIVKN